MNSTMSTIDELASVGTNPSSSSLTDTSRFSRWGGLLAALATTDDFSTACSDDPDIKQMVEVVQGLEASLQDCAVHGPQKMVDSLAACQLTPVMLNRWNSPILDGLWQAVTGRTPGGITPFALNPPDSAAELLDRLVWPRAYPDAIDLVLETMNVSKGGSLVLAPAVVASACVGHIEILKRLLVHPLDEAARKYVLQRLPRITACDRFPCFEILLPHVLPDPVEFKDALFPTLCDRVRAGDLEFVKFLVSHYDVSFGFGEYEVDLAAACPASPASEAIFELFFDAVDRPDDDSLRDWLQLAIQYNRTDVAQKILAYGIEDVEDWVHTCVVGDLSLVNGSEAFALLFDQVPEADRDEMVVECVSSYRDSCNLDVLRILLDAMRDHRRRLEAQDDLNKGLSQFVSRMLPAHIKLLLQHGARARAYDDYIIYLAALSGRADVMELLLAAADVDAECAARYRRQMSDPAGLLGLAKQLYDYHESKWRDLRERKSASQELCAAASGGCIPALELLVNEPFNCRLTKNCAAEIFVAVARSGNVALVRTLLDPRFRQDVTESAVNHALKPALLAARELRNLEMVQLLFPHTLFKRRVCLRDIRDAFQARDPYTRRYLFGYFEPAEVDVRSSTDVWHQRGLPTLFDACMTGDLKLFEDAWTFVRCSFRSNPDIFNRLGPRVDRSLQICMEGDLTPIIVTLMQPSNDDHIPRVKKVMMDDPMDDPLMLAAAWGHLPAVRSWLGQGVPAQTALSAAVKNGQREVVSCLIAHGANPAKLSASERQQLNALLQA